MKRFGWRFWSCLVALVLLAGTLFHPRIVLPRQTHRYLFVLDITQSMNARDYHVPGWPSDRLGFAKAALEQAMLALPCGSEVGLAIFAHKNTYLLLAPLEVCAHGAALRAALRTIDWRSAWAGESHIAYGLFDAWKMTQSLGTSLVFLTDGHQVPAAVKEPSFRGEVGKISGFIIGVGGLAPVPIPKLDLEGRPTGFWQKTDLPHPIHSPRFRHPADNDRSGLLLSHVDEGRLRRLADLTGLDYHHLTTPEALAEWLRQAPAARKQPVAMDLRPWFGFAALIFAFAALV